MGIGVGVPSDGVVVVGAGVGGVTSMKEATYK